jgi:hypothetical protein
LTVPLLVPEVGESIVIKELAVETVQPQLTGVLI